MKKELMDCIRVWGFATKYVRQRIDLKSILFSVRRYLKSLFRTWMNAEVAYASPNQQLHRLGQQNIECHRDEAGNGLVQLMGPEPENLRLSGEQDRRFHSLQHMRPFDE